MHHQDNPQPQQPTPQQSMALELAALVNVPVTLVQNSSTASASGQSDAARVAALLKSKWSKTTGFGDKLSNKEALEFWDVSGLEEAVDDNDIWDDLKKAAGKEGDDDAGGWDDDDLSGAEDKGSASEHDDGSESEDDPFSKAPVKAREASRPANADELAKIPTEDLITDEFRNNHLVIVDTMDPTTLTQKARDKATERNKPASTMCMMTAALFAQFVNEVRDLNEARAFRSGQVMSSNSTYTVAEATKVGDVFNIEVKQAKLNYSALQVNTINADGYPIVYYIVNHLENAS
jgi:hypothetical protein